MTVLIRPKHSLHEAKPFLQHTKEAIDRLIEVITPALENGYADDAEEVNEKKRYRWRFPDTLDSGKDVTQIFAMVGMIWRELEDAIEVFAEEYDEQADDLCAAASNLDSYASEQDLEALEHLETASILIGDAMEEI